MNNRQMKNVPDDVPILGQSPIVELYADKTVIVEEIGSLLFFDRESVCIGTKKRIVRITGRDLAVNCLSSGALAVSGEVTDVTFERRTG